MWKGQRSRLGTEGETCLRAKDTTSTFQLFQSLTDMLVAGSPVPGTMHGLHCSGLLLANDEKTNSHLLGDSGGLVDMQPKRPGPGLGYHRKLPISSLFSSGFATNSGTAFPGAGQMGTGCFRPTSNLLDNHREKGFDGNSGLGVPPICRFPMRTFSFLFSWSFFLLYGPATRCYCPVGPGRVGTTQNPKSTGNREEAPPPEWRVAQKPPNRDCLARAWRE